MKPFFQCFDKSFVNKWLFLSMYIFVFIQDAEDSKSISTKRYIVLRNTCFKLFGSVISSLFQWRWCSFQKCIDSSNRGGGKREIQRICSIKNMLFGRYAIAILSSVVSISYCGVQGFGTTKQSTFFAFGIDEMYRSACSHSKVQRWFLVFCTHWVTSLPSSWFGSANFVKFKLLRYY